MLTEPLTDTDATRLIKTIVATGHVTVTGHAAEEMANDGLTVVDITNVLRAGFVEFSEYERGSWRYRMRTARIVVPVAFRSEAELVVITAWRVKR